MKSPSSTGRLAVSVAALLASGVHLAAARPSPGRTAIDLVRRNTSGSGVNNTVVWEPCSIATEAGTTDLNCTSITVPKNYFDSTKGYSTIALAKFDATANATEKLGTVFVNPGGPGASGITFMGEAAASVSQLTGGLYDIIGFDPRGVGSSTPAINCFPTESDFVQFHANTIFEKGADLPPGSPFTHDTFVKLVDNQRQLDAGFEAWYSMCGETVELEDLKQSGTSTVVRDLEFISNALEGKDAKINYMGFSYGTVLGSYLISMLPASKIGRVILDGIVDTELWASTPVYTTAAEAVESSEAAYQWFLHDCASSGPDLCPLATSANDTAAAISARIFAWIDSLFTSPLPITDSYRPGFLNSGLARGQLYASLEEPEGWAQVAAVLAQALAGNGTALYEQAVLPFDTTAWSVGDTSRQAVSCADSRSLGDGEDEFSVPSSEFVAGEVVKALKVSERFGASASSLEPDGGCQFWPSNGAKAEGTFTGPFGATLDSPILLVSNTADPDTSLKNGVKMDKLFGDSSLLLIQNSPGHTSLLSSSACTQQYYFSYMTQGVLPEAGTVCELDSPSFFSTDANSTAVAEMAKFAAKTKKEALAKYVK